MQIKDKSVAILNFVRPWWKNGCVYALIKPSKEFWSGTGYGYPVDYNQYITTSERYHAGAVSTGFTSVNGTVLLRVWRI